MVLMGIPLGPWRPWAPWHPETNTEVKKPDTVAKKDATAAKKTDTAVKNTMLQQKKTMQLRKRYRLWEARENTGATAFLITTKDLGREAIKILVLLAQY